LFENPENVGLPQDQEVLAVEAHFRARPLSDQDLVAGLHVERTDLAVLVPGAGADGDDLGLHWLLLGGIGDDDAARRSLFGLNAADEDAVVQRSEVHADSPTDAGLPIPSN